MATTSTPSTPVPDDLAASLKALWAASQAPNADDASAATLGGQTVDPVMSGLDAYRPNLGRRTPPQYDAALASLQRAIY
jgi:hypothetical protein